MTESERHVMTIFSEALDRESADERAAYLDQACGANAALRERVEALLRAHGQVGGFLEAPHTSVSELSATVDAPPTLTAGAVIAGRYRLIEEIGEGGMGTVWMAQQTEPIKRAVAVKLIKAGLDSKQMLARFEAERQALALMDHPNIAKVLDAGTTSGEPGGVSPGRPYFVMDLVKGKPITKYCDEQRLTPRQRLELFVPVCQAVQHAHQKGIIHRDLKPSNILVARYDGKPVPKVIDFGVAKAAGQQLTDRTLMTGFGVVVGTLEYMSPEQAELNQLDVDTRSDIYSLGVVLYELLTGSTPLDRKRLKQAAFAEVLRVIREEDPQKPSTRLSDSTESLPSISAQRHMEPAKLTKLVRGELDWIVMKALEKDRNRRYETANGFAMDVQRYLADEPVQASPPSAWYRFRKFARRNKTALAATGLILFFIALFGGTAGWVMRDRAARQDQAANDLERALDRAELFLEQGQRAEALAALERVEVLAGQAPSDAARDERLATLKERFEADARDQKFIAQFEKFQLEARSQFNVQENQLGGSIAELRDAFTQFGIPLEDLDPAKAAARIAGRPELVRLQLIGALGVCLELTEHGQPLRPWLLAVLDIADTDPWRTSLRQAGKERTDANKQALEKLALEVDVRTQPPSFLLLAARSVHTNKSVRLALYRRIQHANPADLWANYDLAFELIDNRRLAEAVRYFTAALALRPNNAGIYYDRGKALMEAGEVEASIADYRRAIALEPKYAMAYDNLGNALQAKGQFDEAIATFRQAIRLKKDPLAYHGLGIALQSKGRLDEAVAALREAIRLKRDFVEAHNNLGATLGDMGDLDGAIAAFREAIRFKNDDAESHNNLGVALRERGQVDEAIAAFREAIRFKNDYAEAYGSLGALLRQKGQFREALEELRRSHELGSRNPRWPYPSAQWVQQCERLVELDKKLPDILQRKTQLASPRERAELAEVCSVKQLHLTAAQFYVEAFAAEPKLKDKLDAWHRYNAACAAALAGCGQGKDADRLKENVRADLRRLALDWLRADLTAWQKELAKNSKEARETVRAKMIHWQGDKDFGGVRGAEALAKLPEPERQAWQKLWDDVAATLDRAQESPKPDKP